MTVDRYFGFKEETTFGTFVAVDNYLDLARETLAEDLYGTPVQSAGKRWDVDFVYPRQLVKGDVITQPRADTFPWFLKWVLGTISSTKLASTPDVYKHECTPGDIIKSFSAEVGVETQSRQIPGCLMNQLTLESTARDGVLLATLGVIGQGESKASAGSSITFSTLKVLLHSAMTATVATVDKSTEIKAARVVINNNIPVDSLFGASWPKIARIGVQRLDITGQLQFDFVNWDQYDRFIGEGSFAVLLTYKGEATGNSTPGADYYELIVNLPKCYYTGHPVPNIDQRNRPTLTGPFKAIYDSSSGFLAKLTMINKSTSYGS